MRSACGELVAFLDERDKFKITQVTDATNGGRYIEVEGVVWSGDTNIVVNMSGYKYELYGVQRAGSDLIADWAEITDKSNPKNKTVIGR